jgi:hypothetical protein
MHKIDFILGIFRPVEQNSPEAIVNKIAKVGVSAGVANLLKAALSTIMTMVAPPQGAGPMVSDPNGILPNGNVMEFYNFNADYQIAINNNDNRYCLFIALEITRLYHDNKIRRWQNKPDWPLLTQRGKILTFCYAI